MKVEHIRWTAPKFYTEAWVSPEARAYWEPIIRRLADYWLEVEIRSVLEKLRYVCVQIYRSDNIIRYSEIAFRCGFVSLPVESVDGGQRVIIGQHNDVTVFHSAWKNGDKKTIAEMLGYPECCAYWFNDLWYNQKKIDTCLGMKSSGIMQSTSNVLLRDLGIRPVFHLPCSWECQETSDVAKMIANICRGEELTQIYKILRWPVKYSSLHGIAEITTPILKIRRNTDYEPSEKIVEYKGTHYPIYGASGNKFPFINRVERAPLKLVRDIWTDNGFKNMVDMEKAHGLILNALNPIIDRGRPCSVVDFGCGNGRLLREVTRLFPNVAPVGIDRDPEKIERAKIILPNGIFKVVDLVGMDFDRTYDIALISYNRFQELSLARRQALRNRLRRFFKKIVVYSYDEMTIKEVADGWDESAERTQSSTGSKVESSASGNESGGNADDDNGRESNIGATIRSLSNRPLETG